MGWKYLQSRRGFGLAWGESTGMQRPEATTPLSSNYQTSGQTHGVYLANAEATQAYGQQLAQQLPPGALLLLKGNLGAGKTCLVQGLAAGLGLTEPVTSPTFALAQHYGLAPGGGFSGTDPLLVHLDLYRLEQAAAADDLFCQEEEQALAWGALLAVEWPERLSFVPEGAWQLSLSEEGEGRRAVLVSP